MERLTVTLETVTPLFLAGANPRGAPELRPPAFRGALRYWLRAALGGVYGDSDEGLAQVRRLEAEILGSTEEKTGGASAIAVRISPPASLPTATYASSRRSGGQRAVPSGRDYLYWSMDASGSVEKGNYQPAKQYVPAGTRFDLCLCPRTGAVRAAEKIEQAAAALWLLVQLGGVGSRARRTAGSLSATWPEGCVWGRFADAVDVAGAASALGRGLQVVKTTFKSKGPISLGPLSEFDVLHPSVCRIWVLDVWPNAEAAVDAIGSALRRFRDHREPDHTQVARWLNGESIPTVERAVFGLPLPYRYSDGRTSGVVQAATAAGGRDAVIDRRASPLWLKVSKAGKDRYIGVATLFKSRLLPQGARLQARSKGYTPKIPPPPDYCLLEQWITEAFPGSQEVRYA